MTTYKSKIKYLDNLFSEYIRKRDVGYYDHGRCISCGCLITFNTCECGHYIPGRHNGLRYDFDNAHAQCGMCNRFLVGNLKSYRINLIKKIGIVRVEDIEAIRHKNVKLNEFDLDEIRDKIKKALAEL